MTADSTEAREILLRHAKSKRNGIFPSDADRRRSMLNPLCGDQVELRAEVSGERIAAIGFSAKACAICTASASLVAEAAAGWSREDAQRAREEFERAAGGATADDWPASLEAFRCFEHLRANPRRRACAILPWIALTRLFEEA